MTFWENLKINLSYTIVGFIQNYVIIWKFSKINIIKILVIVVHEQQIWQTICDAFAGWVTKLDKERRRRA
jgi:hypothetical protein